jgi:hypothetical protein
MVRAGVLTPNDLRSTAWRRLFRDVYVCASASVDHALRARAAATFVLPGAVVTGRSAAVLWGLPLAETVDDVELTVPPGESVSAVRGVRVRRRALAACDVTRRQGVPVTTALATALDLAGRLPQEDAVVLLDRFVLAGRTNLRALDDAAQAASGPGSRRAREAVALADGLAESPQETRVRLLLHRCALPRPIAQYTVRHEGRFVARVDFGWPEQRLAVEYEGVWHGERQQVARDRRRLNALLAAGWRVVFITAEDLRRPERLIRRIAAALAA